MEKKESTFIVDLSELRRTLPPVVARKKLDYYLGGLISKGYMANLDCTNSGAPKIKIGKSVGYLRDPLVDWLESRIQLDEGDHS